ncbi:MAG TPA: DUF2087 domain-containing protein [Actinomycetes bacterium]
MESAQAGALTPREILGLLAEEDRLKAVAALALGATTTAEIAAATGLGARQLGRALARLAAGGLVEGDPAGYRLRTEVLREAAMADVKPEPDAPLGAGVLRRFIRGNRLTSLPAARGKRLLVLDHLAGLFEPGRRYTEPEVNQVLGAWHPDYAALRRHLVDEGFLKRADETDPATSRSVKHYWRSGGSFDVD